MFTSKVKTNDSRLLQESNLAARQPQGAISVKQAITGEGLAQGPYMAARGGVEPTTFHTKGTDNIHLANHAPSGVYQSFSVRSKTILSQLLLATMKTMNASFSFTILYILSFLLASPSLYFLLLCSPSQLTTFLKNMHCHLT